VIKLFDKETGRKVGIISEAQWQFLVDQLEEESSDDQDYYIDAATIEMLQDAGADPALTDLLRSGLDGRDGYEVAWEREDVSDGDGDEDDEEDE
jgi:hypothetical protein